VEAQLELERVQQIDSMQMQSLLLAMEGARAQVLAQQAAVEQAGKAVDITMILYKEGRATLLDVENAQARVRDARLAGDRIKLQFLEAYAELKSLAGDGR
jgi:outer membrane protein TolC